MFILIIRNPHHNNSDAGETPKKSQKLSNVNTLLPKGLIVTQYIKDNLCNIFNKEAFEKHEQAQAPRSPFQIQRVKFYGLIR